MMQQQGITFDTASGIDLTGWWSNPRTGESYRIVDQFFQDNVLYVRTDKGQVLNYNLIQNLVKSDGPLNGPVEKPKPAPINNDVLLQGLEDEDIDILTRPVRSQQSEKPKQEITKDSVNKVIIEKAFSKASEGPKVNLSIEWKWEQLGQTISMLTDTMDVPIEEITDYVYDKYASDMLKTLKEMLKEHLEGQKS